MRVSGQLARLLSLSFELKGPHQFSFYIDSYNMWAFWIARSDPPYVKDQAAVRNNFALGGHGFAILRERLRSALVYAPRYWGAWHNKFFTPPDFRQTCF